MGPAVHAPSSPSPRRRRRRWLIVAFVLVLVSTVSWWCWPRGDARFVGKWKFSRISDNAGSTGGFCFRSNGIGWTVATPTDPNRFAFSWEVAGDVLSIGRDKRERSSRMTWSDHINSIFLKWSGRGWLTHEMRFEILEVDTDVIRLRTTDVIEDYVLTRIPE